MLFEVRKHVVMLVYPLILFGLAAIQCPELEIKFVPHFAFYLACVLGHNIFPILTRTQEDRVITVATPTVKNVFNLRAIRLYNKLQPLHIVCCLLLGV